jgi:hypothetical protein
MLVLQVPHPMGTQCHLCDVTDQAKDSFLSAAAECKLLRSITSSQIVQLFHNDDNPFHVNETMFSVTSNYLLNLIYIGPFLCNAEN